MKLEKKLAKNEAINQSILHCMSYSVLERGVRMQTHPQPLEFSLNFEGFLKSR